MNGSNTFSWAFFLAFLFSDTVEETHAAFHGVRSIVASRLPAARAALPAQTLREALRPDLTSPPGV
eukprot:jgi/Pico_ML_1/54340/g4702.t1